MRQSRSVYNARWRAKKLSQAPDYFKKKYLEKKHLQSLRQREYYTANRERVLAKMSSYYHSMTAKEREEHNRKRRERHARQPEVRNRIERIRDHKKRAHGSLTRAVWEEVCRRYADTCIYCGSTEKITIEHLTPVSRGGTNKATNLAPACLSCNSSKRNKTYDEYVEWRKFIKK